MSSVLAGLACGIPVIAFWFLLPTAWVGKRNFEFVDNPKGQLDLNPHNSTARFNDEGVPVSPGGSA